MDGNYILPLVRAVKHVFATMLQLEVTVGEPRVKAQGAPLIDVSGIIGLSGDLTGAVVLGFTTETAERIVSLFTGMEMTAEHDDFTDAVGELVNMVTGNAKAEYTHHHVLISCPSVVVGKGHEVLQNKNQPVVEIPFECDCGQFFVQMSLKESPRASVAGATAGAVA